MATLQSLGIGSGMDIAGLVGQLVAAERAPKQQQITTQQTKVAVQLSAMGTLKGVLSGFQAAANALKTSSSFDVFRTKSSDETVFTAAAGGTAPQGSYDVEVIRLASAHQLSSNAFAAADVVGTGMLSVSVGSKSFQVEVASDKGTLASIRDAINGASGNSSVRATIVNGAEGAHLVLTALESGQSNAISVAASGGDGGLERLTYSPNATSNYTEVRGAQDALIEIAGIEHASASNTVKGAIDGVTLTLIKADPGNAKSLSVERNVDALVTRINAFVTQYNSLSGALASLQSYDAATRRAGPLLGDSLVRGIESGIRRELVRPAADNGDYSTLSSLGISMTKEGRLELDQAELREVLRSDSDAVQNFFATESGLAARLDKIIAPQLSVDGSIAERNKTLDARSKRLENDTIALNARMKVLEARYMKQFTALDTLLAQSQSTSSYLAQQLANLPKVGGNS